MSKKCVFYASILAAITIFLCAKVLQTKKFEIFNPVSQTMAQQVWDEKIRVDRFDFGCLMCNGIQVPVDTVEKTFYIPVNMETEEWETMEFASGNPEYQIVFREDFTKYNKKDVIAGAMDIEFLVYTDTEFSTYHMIFTGLPIMDISTDQGIIDQKEISGYAAFYDTNFLTQGIQTSSYNGNVRGNTSTLYPKKGYKINLIKQETDGTVVNNKLPLFGMREDDDWLLYAIYNDDSKMRAKLSIDLWNEFGAKEVSANSTYNTNMTYIELLVDNSYYGLYGIMERIDAKQMNLQPADYMYKYKETSEFSPDTFMTATNLETYVQGFELKEGILNEDAWIPMAEISKLYQASDEDFVENVSDLIDEDNAIRMWLFTQLITGVDQSSKNILYVAKKELDNYRFYFAPWDMDLTWGNISAGIEPLYTVYNEELVKKAQHCQPGDRLVRLNVNGAEEKMQKLYAQMRQDSWSDEALEERILELDDILRNSGAYFRDQNRWPEGAYAEDCSILIDYAKKRMEYLDTALFDLENY